MKKCIPFVTCLLLSGQAIADGEMFKGLSFQIGIGAEKGGGHVDDFRDPATGQPFIHPIMNETIMKTIDQDIQVIANIGLLYTFQLNEKWLIGLGAEFNPFHVKAGTNKLWTTSGTFLYSESNNSERRLSLFATPSYLVSDDSIIYAKLGYSELSVSVTNEVNLPSEKLTHRGIIYGAGYKKFIDQNFYVYGEGNYIHYNKKNDEPSRNGFSTFDTYTNARNIVIGVGYQF